MLASILLMGIGVVSRLGALLGAAAVLCLCACGEEFEGDGKGGGGSGAGAPPPCSPGNMDTLVDDFEDGDLDPLWLPLGQTDLVSEAGGRLAFSLIPNTAEWVYAAVVSVHTYDLLGCPLAVELVEAPADRSSPAQFGIEVTPELGNTLFMGAGLDLMRILVAIGGTPTEDRYANFDPALDRWWRIREQDSTLFFETSSDAASWTELVATPTPAFVDNVPVSFSVLTTAAHPDPGGFAIDNVNRLP